MSGVVGSKLNIRGSGRVAKLGTDGQVLTSSGAGVQANYEDAPAGGTSWQSVVTASTFTAVAGNGYPVNTTSNACTVTLPASASVGDEIIFTDYARNFATNALTIDQNSLKYQGQTSPNPVYDTAGESIHIVYMDATNGWIPTYDGAVADEVPQSYTAEWLIIAGGAGGAEGGSTGGGGAGGYRNAYASETSGGGGSTETVATLTGGVVYTIDIGAGGADTTDGEDSSISGSGFSTLTSTGGGTGGLQSETVSEHTGDNGGCGGGGGSTASGDGTVCPGGSGTTDQGYGGGSGRHVSGSWEGGGGGGGAGVAGGNGTGAPGVGGSGGNGLASDITASSVTRGGGGGARGGTAGSGGSGGGGAGNNPGTGTAGTANTGGGGGAGNGAGGAGGSGVIILRIPDANYSGTTSGSPTIDTSSVADETILTYNGDGTYTA